MYTKEKNNIDKSLPPDKNDSWCDARHPPPSPPALYLRTNTPQREGDEMQLLIIKYINVYVYIYVSLRPLIPPPRLNKVDPNWAVRGVHTDVIQRIRLNSSTIWFFAGVGVIFCHAWHMLIGKQTCWFTIRVFIRERKKQIPNLNPHASSIVDLTFGIKGMGWLIFPSCKLLIWFKLLFLSFWTGCSHQYQFSNRV
jgi:hypothetical protein